MANEKLIVESKLRDAIREIDPGMRVSGEYLEELNKHLATKLKRHVARALGNDRKTLKPEDL